jgi:hypothetical protein
MGQDVGCDAAAGMAGFDRLSSQEKGMFTGYILHQSIEWMHIEGLISGSLSLAIGILLTFRTAEKDPG